tara:strand:+ start:923 stop:1171 length:249 start_codon:yes stop_codon:yes gene_type:complete
MSIVLGDPVLLNSFCHQIIVVLVYEKSTASDYLKVLPLLQIKNSDETIQEIVDLLAFKYRKFNRNDINKIKLKMKLKKYQKY